MEHNGYYTSDPRHHKNREGRGGNAFAGIVITIVLVLLVLLVIGLFWPNLLGMNAADYAIVNVTPSPSVQGDGTVPPADLPAATATPEPTPTPVVPEQDRVMPNLDGISPALPGLNDNPIPDIYDAVSPGVVGVQERGAAGRRQHCRCIRCAGEADRQGCDGQGLAQPMENQVVIRGREAFGRGEDSATGRDEKKQIEGRRTRGLCQLQ